MTEPLRHPRALRGCLGRHAPGRGARFATSRLAGALTLPRPLTLTLALTLAAMTGGAEAVGGASGASAGWPLAPAPFVIHPFDPPSVRWDAGHRGVDLAATPGQPLLSPRPAVVGFAGTVAGVPAISLDHPDGTRTTYQPAATVLSLGAPVTAGEPFAVVVPGTSHCAPRTCLHWGLRRGKEYLDPLTLIEIVRIRLLPLFR